MNEQFSRLYHLAWNYAESDPEYRENPTYERRCVVQSRIFAELIVEECADIAKHHVMNISTYADAEFVEEQIREHFGVEE